MRSRLLLAGVLAAGSVALVGLVAALRPEPPQTPAEQAAALAAELRCPDCQSLSVAESRTAAATAIRAEIEAQLAAGRTSQQIRQHFVERYGEWILLTPADPLAWWLPMLAGVVGVGLFALWMRTGRAAPQPAPAVALSEAERRRVREELETLDG